MKLPNGKTVEVIEEENIPTFIEKTKNQIQIDPDLNKDWKKRTGNDIPKPLEK